MKKSAIHNKYIAFTFSLRNVGLERTLEFLSQFMNIPKCYSAPSLHVCELKSRQFVKQFLSTDESTTTRLPLYMYRDSGACMISGLIKL